jgi:hypothetical protein
MHYAGDRETGCRVRAKKYPDLVLKMETGGFVCYDRKWNWC